MGDYTVGQLLDKYVERGERIAELEERNIALRAIREIREKRIAELEGDLKWAEELNERRLQDVRNRDKRIAELEAALEDSGVGDE